VPVGDHDSWYDRAVTPPSSHRRDPGDDGNEDGRDPAHTNTDHTQVLRKDQRDAARVRPFTVHVVAGPDAGASFTHSGERIAIGTHDSADVILHDPTVSRFHCELTRSEGKTLLRDLGSSNGTFVGGCWIREAFLRGGALISIGQTQLRFDLAVDTVVVPLSERERFGLLVGRSTAMRAVFARLEHAAGSDVTVLLEGETGTGKEATAESIHTESARRDRPFIIVDCGAIPPNLLESELFGHERGAFTGAQTARRGAFEAADGGTVFLDEIGELGPELQPKLLRVLERHEIKRLGSDAYHSVDIRVIAATNRNLRGEVNGRRFRADLYYRLAVLSVRLPPLRERLEDLDLLVEGLLTNLEASRRPEVALVRAPEFLANLARHSWPGNVRELRNYIERCLALREETPIDVDVDVDAAGDAPPDAAANTAVAAADDVLLPLKTARERANRAFERQYLKETMRRHDSNVSAAARAAGVDRMYFYRLLWRHNLR
jgi:two-component system response regulator GlrR